MKKEKDKLARLSLAQYEPKNYQSVKKIKLLMIIIPIVGRVRVEDIVS